MESDTYQASSWFDRPVSFLTHWNVEKTIITVILVLTVLSRFVNVGMRVMSHDETNHVVPSWELYQGRGYRHDPVTHGPFQFHLVALSYFLLGDNDFSSRVPAALFSTAAVAFVMFGFRRYLGRKGAIIAGFLFMISPFMMFYGRYVRNEGFIELFGVLMLYALLRYLDKGDRLALVLLTLSVVLHFVTKETSYIYTAELLLVTAVIFLERITARRWPDSRSRNQFILLMAIALVLFGLALGMGVWNASLEKAVGTDTSTAAVVTPMSSIKIAGLIGLVGAGVVGLLAAVLLIRRLGWEAIRSERSFDVLILVGTLILPTLSAFPVKLIGWNPLDYTSTGLFRTGIFVAITVAISVLIGLWWKPRTWLLNAVIFWSVFIVFYTTFFTNGSGFFTGLVGSLGYWLEQQGVQRGSQPWYYYALIEVPIYEFLAAAGTILAVYFGIRYRKFSTVAGYEPAFSPVSTEPVDPVEAVMEPAVAELTSEPTNEVQENLSADTPVRKVPVLFVLIFWSFTSLFAFSMAGEKMSWLTVHITLPMLLAAGWGLSYLIDTTPWKKLANRNGLIAALLLPVMIASLASVIGSLLGSQRPFMGSSLEQLEATSTFVISLVVLAITTGGLVYLLNNWQTGEVLKFLTVGVFAFMAILTARAAYRASFIDYDYAFEYLVYAHAGPAPKQVLSQIEEISRRTTGGLDIVVAYDNDALYPYWWYLRDYPNKRWYTDKPTHDLQDAAVIIAGESTNSKLTSIVQNNYVEYEYIRLWWPNQDYFNLTWDRLWGAISNPDIRAGIFDIWLNRDYAQYAKATNNTSLTATTWQPSSRMYFYIRKDIVSKIWNYGAAPVAQTEVQTDPYEKGILTMSPDLVIGQVGELKTPRGVAVAPDGTIYVSDAGNNRIVHYSADGKLIQAWGSFADVSKGEAPGGTFYEPWGLAADSEGSVYVADTWNHRIQKFTADGQFIKMWGYFGNDQNSNAFWGPRDIKIDSHGRVYVTDTGNKRVAIFTKDGEFVAQFGSAGMDVGQFDEPVGLAIDSKDAVYVTDTWNHRIQSFTPDQTGMSFTSGATWQISGWFGQSVDNKPYIAVTSDENLLVTDPESSRILEFDTTGKFLRGWGEYRTEAEALSIYSGVAADSHGDGYVVDAANNRVLRFKLK
jgi:predicted membrane-bound mannosyltransferase/sugar lactone lactonase YvrE